MAKGIIGSPFTFTAFFIDDSGDPITPTSVDIEVFYFDSDGDKQELVAAGTPMVVVAGDTGRYAYTITLTSSLSAAEQVYGTITAVDPDTGFDIIVEEQVDLFEPSSGGSTLGLRSSFIKPSGWP